MSSSKAELTARTIWNAWSSGLLLDDLPPDERPIDAIEGHAAQAALDAYGGSRLGWKIAATSKAGQAHIDVSGPLSGRLFSQFAFEDGATLPSDRLHMAVIEAELAFRMGQTLHSPALSQEDVTRAVDGMFLAIEVPDSRFRSFERAGEAQLIADNACAGRFVLGPEVSGWRDFDLAAQRVRVQLDGEWVADGVGSNVLSHPLAALTWLANDLTARGVPLAAGEIVTTGTTTVPVAIHPGADVLAHFPGMGEVRVSFAE